MNNKSNSVGVFASKFLSRCGYSDEAISNLSYETRLFHDMGICGDDGFDFLKILEDEFSVDMHDFCFEKYFPAETSWDAFFLAIRPIMLNFFLKEFFRKISDKYQPITLKMIDSAIENKKWPHDQSL